MGHLTYATPNNLTGLGGVFTYVNTLTGSWFITLMLVVAAIIIFATSKRLGNRTSDSLLLSLFLSFVISTLCWAAALVQGKIVIILMILMVLSGIYSMLES